MKLAKTYQPELYESDIYALWEKSGAFTPKGNGAGYSLVVPPPNANGNLHMGHALAFAIQDCLARYHRSKGERVLFVPGADHAGFETQVVFERELEKQGKSRFDLSRDDLYGQIFDFVGANRTNFESQIRQLGASVDWTHYSFSLDPEIIRQVYDSFRQMWNQGLIYRGERLVNYCTFHGTAFADIEVVYKEEQGTLWQIRYPLTDSTDEIIVATSRPETMLGDTAVAVNPDDKRYARLIGKTVRLPLTLRDIPIISDTYVDPQFGTGAVKITPAHDPNDFDIAKRHDLPFITVIGFDGKLTHDAPEPFRGMSVAEGREAIINVLREQGLLVDANSYTHNVGHCYKCGTVIEPLLKDQWFVDIKPLSEPVIKLLQNGKVQFLPKAKLKQLIRYLESIKDWNISRQIAWGIPIPAFQNVEDPDDWIYNERVDQETLSVNNRLYRRDPDVFDTWFSSGSWPYSTLGYPDSQDFTDFYPLSVMETGFDILMPWVSRMLMLGLYVTGRLPFKTVYLHGLIMDDKGRKMSKSKGNVVNPIEVAGRYGSDALRIGVITGTTPGNNQPYLEAKVIGGRNFCNKLWNIARYIEDSIDFAKLGEPSPKSVADHWILDRYNLTKKEMIRLMDNYRIYEAYERLYQFVWYDFADWYIEASKLEKNDTVLAAVLEGVLVLSQPFTPFLSETIWQTLQLQPESLLASQPIIDLPQADHKSVRDFSSIKALVTQTRSTVKALGAKDVVLYYQDEPLIAGNSELIRRLGGLKAVEGSEQEKGIALAGINLNCWLDISQALVDNYLNSLDKQISAKQDQVNRLQARLKNASYIKQAPAALVEESRQQLAAAELTLEEYLIERQRYHT